jgi:SAM-dependent methyltransferase
VKRLEGIDVYALDEHWGRIVPALRGKWPAEIAFRQASIEHIPFENAAFDVIVTAAVLEHVRNLDAIVDETARVLKPGGYALHSFGPLYYCFGADHCIAAYGMAASYDHLLLSEADYRCRIEDREHLKSATGNPDLAFWAVNDQISFATGSEYLAAFQRRFEIAYVVTKISPEAIGYRERFPERWGQLLEAGPAEADLLVKSLTVVLRRPERRYAMA